MIFEKLRFKLKWRAYQANVLENFDKHIEDNHFHIVAPPGSGKTILGIEIIKRLHKKTLVLAPTLTIRNQWKNRLQTFFTENKSFKNFSFDLKAPSDITFSTYQALHTFYKTFENEENYYDFFKEHEIEVLLLDEAHHLKNAWWNCLYNLKEQHLQTVVALTATPPYDSEKSEIIKYFKLCGEIDDEIVIPDLIKEKNLAPHQDLIYLSKPESEESIYITNFKENIKEFVYSLFHNSQFVELIQNHRFYKFTSSYLEEVYKHPDFFSSILIFLNALQVEIPKDKLELLGFDEKEEITFPEASYEWIQVLLQGILVTDRENLEDQEEYLISLEKELRKLSAFSRKKVHLNGNEHLYKSLSNSPSKLKSIKDIVRQEQKNLQEDLRCVILTDYIRKEYLTTPTSEIDSIDKIGVIPIFLQLKNQVFYPKALAVLSGSIVIIHQDLIEQVEKIDHLDNYKFSYLESDNNYVFVTSTSSSSKSIVEVITKLFELGHIKVLIGTKSLLGEGWDAPSINSLILASFVGSFVTSNQMRGRAIRTNPKNPNKVGLIWHLACVDPTDHTGGKDFELLSRRFNSFLGVSNGSDVVIQNGLSRLNLPEKIFVNDVESLNRNTILQSEKREKISSKWNNSIFNGKKIYDEISLVNPKKKATKSTKLDYINALLYSFGETSLVIGMFIVYFSLLFIIDDPQIKKILYFSIVSIFIWGIFSIHKNTRSYLKYGLYDTRVHKIALAVLDTLVDLKIITTPKNKLRLKTRLKGRGEVGITIYGANRFESKTFVNILNEILLPVDNPKYLLREYKKSWISNKFKKYKYIVVPELFGVNKKQANLFLENWNKRVGMADIIYTRTLDGRKQLLKARLQKIKTRDKTIVKKNVIWR
jgi:superfamily II DNA or RNA helicase